MGQVQSTFVYSEYLHQRVLGEHRGMEHQSEVWSGAHGFGFAVSPAPAAQQAVADAGRAGVSGGARFGGKKQKTKATSLQITAAKVSNQ